MKLTITAIGIAATALLILAVIWSHHRQPDQRRLPAHAPSTGPRFAASRAETPYARPTQPISARDVDQLLPFPRSQITEAAQLAQRFTAAYATYRYGESPEQYLQRLQPMMTPQLRTSVWLAATDPTVQAQRRRAQAAATGQAHLEAIRSLGPSSITFEATATEHTTSPHATWTETNHYRLTVTHRHGRWLVYAIELTTTGDHGDQP